MNVPLLSSKEILSGKFEEIYVDLPWVERLDCTNAPLPAKDAELPVNDDETLADNDFKREMLLYYSFHLMTMRQGRRV